MKKLYQEPKLVIELFPGQDILTFSGGDNPGYDEEDPEDPVFGDG